MKKLALLFIVFFSLEVAWAQQIQLQITGDATFSDSKFSVSEAGLDFLPTVRTRNSIYMSITQSDYWTQKNNPNGKWRIHVSKQDSWDEELQLAIRRTGNGYRVGSNGNPNIHNGGTYQVIRNNETEFFYGKGEIQNIPIKLRLRGHSLTMGAGTHSSRIIFTVYDSW